MRVNGAFFFFCWSEEEGWGWNFSGLDFLGGGEGRGEMECFRLLLVIVVMLIFVVFGAAAIAAEESEEAEESDTEPDEPSDEEWEEEEEFLVAAFEGAVAVMGVGGMRVTLESEDGFEAASVVVTFVFWRTGTGKSLSEDDELLELSELLESDDSDLVDFLGGRERSLDPLVVAALACLSDRTNEEAEEFSLSDEVEFFSESDSWTGFVVVLVSVLVGLEGLAVSCFGAGFFASFSSSFSSLLEGSESEAVSSSSPELISFFDLPTVMLGVAPRMPGSLSSSASTSLSELGEEEADSHFLLLMALLAPSPFPVDIPIPKSDSRSRLLSLLLLVSSIVI